MALAQQGSDLTVLLPAYNEAPVIDKVIEGIKVFLPCNILVVDNGSSNGTRSEAEACGVRVISEPKPGKGNAIQTGLRHIDTPYIIMMDSDWTYPAYSLSSIYRRLREQSDVVMGWRYQRQDGAMTKTNIFGNWALSQLAGGLYGFRVRDLCTGMWGFRKEVLDKFLLTSEGFTLEADLFVNAVKSGCIIQQIPINYRARIDGTKPKLKVWDGFRIGWFLIRRRFQW